jgi:hypothetical protein
MRLGHYSYHSQQLRLGDLLGNKFTVVMRCVCDWCSRAWTPPKCICDWSRGPANRPSVFVIIAPRPGHRPSAFVLSVHRAIWFTVVIRCADDSKVQYQDTKLRAGNDILVSLYEYLLCGIQGRAGHHGRGALEEAI